MWTKKLRFLLPTLTTVRSWAQILQFLNSQWMFRLACACCVAVFWWTSADAAFAQVTQFPLVPSNGVELDKFGASVAISGDLAVIGAPKKDDGAQNTGAAYIFRRVGENRTEEASLTSPDQEQHHFFGSAVATDGNVVVVGANQVISSGPGVVYVYRQEDGSWILEGQLTASDAAVGDLFATTITVEGDVLLVGAPFDDDACPRDPLCQSGSVYIFRRLENQWVQEGKLVASDAAAGDNFGFSVDLDADWAMVGARHDDDKGINTGSVYVFRRVGDRWVEDAKLTASAPGSYDDFGTSVAISGENVIVGAPNDDDERLFSGSAYVFRRKASMWVKQIKVTASDPEEADLFGWSVAISEGWAMVGARVKGHPCCERAGAVYLFQDDGTGWAAYLKLTAPSPGVWHQYAYSVSVGATTGIIGSPESGFGFIGSAYVFDLQP